MPDDENLTSITTDVPAAEADPLNTSGTTEPEKDATGVPIPHTATITSGEESVFKSPARAPTAADVANADTITGTGVFGTVPRRVETEHEDAHAEVKGMAKDLAAKIEALPELIRTRFHLLERELAAHIG